MPASASHRTSSSESTDSIRKRVGKACDRCRLKKSKCDGSHPCTRCRADNAICVFGERKKTHDKAHPKGYVEMLEQQQSQLVAGLQETYRRMVAANIWPGNPLSEINGHPLTHDILASLDLLELKHDGSGEHEVFEDDCQKLQHRLVSAGASFVGRQGSVSSDSEQGHPEKHTRTSSHSSFHGTPISAHAAPIFDDNFSFQTSSPSPISQSPAPTMTQLRSPVKPSPLHHESIDNDVYIMPSWQEQLGLNGLAAADLMRSQFAAQTPTIQDHYQSSVGYNNNNNQFEPSMEFDSLMSFGNQQYPNPMQAGGSYNAQDWTNDPMDVDFSKFVQVST